MSGEEPRAPFRALAVPALLAAATLAAAWIARLDLGFLLGETLVRLSRNGILVLALLLPIRAGLGLNFGIVVGAMAGEVGLLLAVDRGLRGPLGILGALALATPLGVAFGAVMGLLLNRARGREMVTALVAGFLANGLYQIVFLFAAGPLLPVRSPELLLPSGRGLRNTIDLQGLQHALDDASPIALTIGGSPVPLLTLLLVGAVAGLHVWLGRTRFGHELRAVGADERVAAAVGLRVSRLRLAATILSTVVAAWGQVACLQSLGTLNTYHAHEQVATFAVAALLVSGASVRRASVASAVAGTALFHALFLVAPLAARELAGDAQVGEYLRASLAYGVICAALALHARAGGGSGRRGRAGTAQKKESWPGPSEAETRAS